jgi:hypothetical protein
LQGGRVGEGTAGLPEGAVRDLRKRESQLEQRIKTASARERELAKRAGQLASRERELEQRASQLGTREGEIARRADQPGTREGDLTERADQLAAKQHELESRPVPEPPAPEPAFGAEPAAATGVTRGGAWNIHDLQHAVDAQADASPQQVEEWRSYLYFLRAHASVDGTLPPSFSSLIRDVFAELLEERSRSAR